MIALDLPAVFTGLADTPVGEVRWVSLPGDECSCPPSEGYGPTAECPTNFQSSCRTFPPAVFEQATQPCKTCEGGKKVKGMNHGPADLLFTCPDCAGRGRPLIDVTVPWCENCEGEWVPVGPAEAQECPECRGANRISVGSYVATGHPPVPVMTEDDGRSAPIGTARIEVTGQGLCVFFRGPVAWAVTLPNPASRVGEWALTLERVA